MTIIGSSKFAKWKKKDFRKILETHLFIQTHHPFSKYKKIFNYTSKLF